MTQHIAVAMSGGVDSSAAAWLLKEQGHRLTGLTLTLFDRDDGNQDAEDARAVAEQLGFPHHVLHMASCFRAQVMDRFTAAYEQGQTPNPCVACNRYVKFGALLDEARALGAEALATGHYAQISRDAGSGRFLLKKAAHPEKDQSYVLYSLTQAQLAASRFPLGHLSKAEIRDIALSQGLVSARKRDSQDICFVPDGDYAGFMGGYTGKTPEEGDFVDKNGAVLGRHKGIIHYTIGQRKGLGIALGEPAFVCGKDPVTRRVVLGKNEDLFTRKVHLTGVNLLSVDAIHTPMTVTARIRSTHRGDTATVVMTGADTATVTFDQPQRAVCAGQSCVFYDGDVVVGGGIIL